MASYQLQAGPNKSLVYRYDYAVSYVRCKYDTLLHCTILSLRPIESARTNLAINAFRHLVFESWREAGSREQINGARFLELRQSAYDGIQRYKVKNDRSIAHAMHAAHATGAQSRHVLCDTRVDQSQGGNVNGLQEGGILFWARPDLPAIDHDGAVDTTMGPTKDNFFKRKIEKPLTIRSIDTHLFGWLN